MNTLRREWLFLLVLGLTAGLILWAWPHTPERVPVHYNWRGEVERYGGRFEALALPPLLLLALALLFVVLPALRPAQRANAAVLRAARLGLAVMALTLTLGTALHWPAGRAAAIGSGAMFLVLGNMIGKTQPSPWVGFRTPWTYRSMLAWQRAQRRSGPALVGLGLLVVLAGSLLPTRLLFPWLLPAGVLLGTLGVTGWLTYRSYLDWRSDPHPEPITTR